MPYAARRACLTPGCRELVERGYCPLHARGATASARGYGRRWRKIRLMVLARDPVCVICHRAASTDADHIVPRAEGGTDALGNLRGLCHACHSRRTAADGGRPRR